MMKSIVRTPFCLIALVLFALVPCLQALETKMLGPDDPVPAGWVRSNYTGTPGHITKYQITRYDNLPVGAVIALLSDEAAPSGWEEQKTTNRTGHPAKQKIIKRVK